LCSVVEFVMLLNNRMCKVNCVVCHVAVVMLLVAADNNKSSCYCNKSIAA